MAGRRFNNVRDWRQLFHRAEHLWRPFGGALRGPVTSAVRLTLAKQWESSKTDCQLMMPFLIRPNSCRSELCFEFPSQFPSQFCTTPDPDRQLSSSWTKNSPARLLQPLFADTNTQTLAQEAPQTVISDGPGAISEL